MVIATCRYYFHTVLFASSSALVASDCAFIDFLWALIAFFIVLIVSNCAIGAEINVISAQVDVIGEEIEVINAVGEGNIAQMEEQMLARQMIDIESIVVKRVSIDVQLKSIEVKYGLGFRFVALQSS